MRKVSKHLTSNSLEFDLERLLEETVVHRHEFYKNPYSRIGYHKRQKKFPGQLKLVVTLTTLKKEKGTDQKVNICTADLSRFFLIDHKQFMSHGLCTYSRIRKTLIYNKLGFLSIHKGDCVSSMSFTTVIYNISTTCKIYVTYLIYTYTM